APPTRAERGALPAGARRARAPGRPPPPPPPPPPRPAPPPPPQFLPDPERELRDAAGVHPGTLRPARWRGDPAAVCRPPDPGERGDGAPSQPLEGDHFFSFQPRNSSTSSCCACGLSDSARTEPAARMICRICPTYAWEPPQ